MRFCRRPFQAVGLALILLLSTTTSNAYVGELSKDRLDNQSEGLPLLADRHRAYGVFIRWIQNAQPDTPMPPEVFQAYKLLKNSDEQVLMLTYQKFLDEKFRELKQKLSPSEYKLLEGYTVKITAAFDGVARVSQEDKTIFIPVDFLHDAWSCFFALEEAEATTPPMFYEASKYCLVRANPQLRRLHPDSAIFGQGMSQAMLNHPWKVSRDKWNEALQMAEAGIRGVIMHEAYHEACHIIKKHKFGASPAITMEQERKADACAFELMSNFRDHSFHPMAAILVLFSRSLDSDGAPINTLTHPPTVCRAKSLLEIIPLGKLVKTQVDKLIPAILPNEISKKASNAWKNALNSCID